LIQLNNFIDKFRIIKTDNISTSNQKQNQIKPTHIAMGSYCGSFNIPSDTKTLFNLFKYYQNTIKAGFIPSILETHLEQGPIVIDLDFKYILDTTTINKRIYTDQDIQNIVTIYNQVILTYIQVCEEDLNIYIMEKSEPKFVSNDDVKNKITYKDGIHIMYPFISVNNKVQLFFRDLVVNKIVEDKILDHLNCTNTVDDIIDKAVIERNSWLLYGSCKDGKEENVYKLTKIYDYKIELMNLSDIDYYSLPTILSIRKFTSSTDNNLFNDNITIDKITTLHHELLGKKNINRSFTINSEIEKAKLLIDIISINRSKSYNSWIEVGFCLHNIDDSLLDTWIDFSKKDNDKFKQGECEQLWAKFKYEGLTIGSLHRWAREDNPTAYSNFLLEELENLLKTSLNDTSYSVANIFYESYKYLYVCTSIKNKKWYEYKNHRWIPMDEANTIIKLLNVELSESYTKLGIAYGQKALHSDGDDNKKILLDKAKVAFKIATNLHKMSYKREIISELLHLYYDGTFAEKLDENRYLIGFDNGVYDLKKKVFRNGRPEDYISFSTNCNYINYDESDKQIIAVQNFFDSIQPNEAMREYLLRKLSSFLEGVQRDQKFEIWTGTGANGKGRILKLVLDAFGDYGCTIPVSLLTRPRGDADSASPALAKTKGKRCCAFQEPENDDKIYIGHMKNLTGGDKLQARSLYTDPVEFYPQFKTILACNKLPDVPHADPAVWRRIRVVPFETKFVDNPDPNNINERKKINDIDDLIDGWRSAFMSLLIEKYKSYITNGINEPAQVLVQTDLYQNSTDVYLEYIKDMIIAGNNNDYIVFDDLWDDFKKWLKESNREGKKKPLKSEIKLEIELVKVNLKVKH
jgi:P4 family phage/plasmid primase-like protien